VDGVHFWCNNKLRSAGAAHALTEAHRARAAGDRRRRKRTREYEQACVRRGHRFYKAKQANRHASGMNAMCMAESRKNAGQNGEKKRGGAGEDTVGAKLLWNRANVLADSVIAPVLKRRVQRGR